MHGSRVFFLFTIIFLQLSSLKLWSMKVVVPGNVIFAVCVVRLKLCLNVTYTEKVEKGRVCPLLLLLPLRVFWMYSIYVLYCVITVLKLMLTQSTWHKALFIYLAEFQNQKQPCGCCFHNLNQTSVWWMRKSSDGLDNKKWHEKWVTCICLTFCFNYFYLFFLITELKGQW